MSSFDGRLSLGDGWLPIVDRLQAALYIAALAIILTICAQRATPPPLRTFLLLALVGIVVNAAICGGVSQPASRYGARVIWLLPATATIAFAMTRRRKRPTGGIVVPGSVGAR